MLKRRAKRGAEVLDKAIARLERQMESGELKGSMSDLVRLLQLRNELKGSEPHSMTVRWIDECQTPRNEE